MLIDGQVKEALAEFPCIFNARNRGNFTNSIRNPPATHPGWTGGGGCG
jgi:hypothetical protein